MNTLEKHFPWMTEADRPWLRTELLRRAAAGFEQVKLWHDAAGCWADLGDHHPEISDAGHVRYRINQEWREITADYERKEKEKEKDTLAD